MNEKLDEDDLEKRLFGGREIARVKISEDGRVRFAPKESYKLGENTSEEFAKSGLMIASCLEEGAEKFREVSARFKAKPCIYGVETETQEQTVSAIYVHGKRFNFYGHTLGENRYGRGLGMLR